MIHKALFVMAIGTLGMVAIASSAGATPMSTVRSHILDVSSDMSAVSDAANDQDVVALESSCRDLEYDVDTVLSDSRPKSFPRTAWRHLRNGMNSFSIAAGYCQSGARNYDSDDLSTATELMTEGGAEIQIATAALT